MLHSSLLTICGRFAVAAFIAGIFPSVVFGDNPTLYNNPRAPLEARVEDLAGRLTAVEKLSLLGGTGFTTQPIARLGIPALAMADAGEGVRGGMDAMLGPATAFPAGVCLASTWNVDLAKREAQAIGEECRNKGPGARMLLGPAVNIHRTPLGGRDSEYLSEDPYLNARMAVAYIQGMQSTGVAACIKHFACNNHEVDRFNMNVQVGERALREIYLPAFEAGVKEGKVWSVMSSYNKLNGTYATANGYLLTDVLKRGWNFDGMVVSDWGAAHETSVVQAGNDVEMPDGKHVNVRSLEESLYAGRVTQAAVDDAVRRIIRTVLRAGLLDGPLPPPDAAKVNSAAHDRIALEAAAEGVVLLKNDHAFLPLDKGAVHSLAVIGEPGRALQVSPLGSPHVHPLHAVQLLDAVRQLVGDRVPVRYATGRREGEPLTGAAVTVPGSEGTHGFRAEYFKNMNLEGAPALVRTDAEINIYEPASPAPGIGAEHYSVRWTARLTAPTTGRYTFTFAGDDGYRLFVDGKPLLDQWGVQMATTKKAQIDLEANHVYDLRAEFFQDGGDVRAQLSWQLPSEGLYAAALAAAKDADACIVCVSTNGEESEGSDRPSMDLPEHQSELIRAVEAVNPRTVVVLNNGTPVTMTRWLPQTPAVLEAWFPGQAGGAALAGILFGQINPSGKLPDTLAARREDYPDFPNYPGKDANIHYAEGIYVGYRHFDKENIEPLFPFGYGLSYTSFRYENLRLSRSDLPPDGEVKASLEVTNTGARAGSEIAQLYIRDLQPKIDRPTRELKGFVKVMLKPAETKTVEFTIKPRDLAYFDVDGKQWRADAGTFQVEVGASSRDFRQQIPLRLDAMFSERVPGSRELAMH